MNVNEALQQCNYIDQDSLFVLHRQMKDALYDPYMRELRRLAENRVMLLI